MVDDNLRMPGNNEGLLLVVDGHAYAYRSFHAIRHLRSPEGKPTNAIFGFIKSLVKLRSLLNPTHIAVIWDGGLAPERMTLLPGYKAQRPPMPEELEAQLDEITAYLKAAGVASLCRDAVEADDWIAALALRASAKKYGVVIASSDKDFMQLVSAEIGIYNPNDKSETVWREAAVVAKTGVRPDQIVDWLSLIGDSVDNIPGVPGVGPKTATDLLVQFNTVDELYQNLSRLKSDRLRGNLEAAKADVERNRKLIKLNADVIDGVRVEDFIPKPSEIEALKQLYLKWGFKSLYRELAESHPSQGELLV